jgi:hypothetical protein
MNMIAASVLEIQTMTDSHSGWLRGGCVEGRIALMLVFFANVVKDATHRQINA